MAEGLGLENDKICDDNTTGKSRFFLISNKERPLKSY